MPLAPPLLLLDLIELQRLALAMLKVTGDGVFQPTRQGLEGGARQWTGENRSLVGRLEFRRVV